MNIGKIHLQESRVRYELSIMTESLLQRYNSFKDLPLPINQVNDMLSDDAIQISMS